VALLYLDSSALVKLVVSEPETEALLLVLAEWPDRVSSELAAVEVPRAARRASGDPAVHRRADQVVAGLHLLRLGAAVLKRAAELGPTRLRTLDAIHLSSALEVGADIGAFVAYDADLGRAAAAAGLRLLAPGG
jgi:predicted nucleic acid-binding protein